METILRFLRRLRVLVLRRQFNRELEEEMIFHREQAEKNPTRSRLIRCRLQCR